MVKTNFNGKKGQRSNGGKSNKANLNSEQEEIVNRSTLKYITSAPSTVTIKASFEDLQGTDVKEMCLLYRDGDAKDSFVELHTGYQ